MSKNKKIELSNNDFALHEGDVRLYPVITDEQVKEAALSLYNDRGNLPFTWRRKAAERIFKEAADRNLDIPCTDYILILNGYGECDLTKAASDISHRGVLAQIKVGGSKGSALKKEYEDLAESILDTYSDGSNVDLKVAEFLATFDEVNELHDFYEKVATPEETIFNVSPTGEADREKYSLELPDGTVVDSRDITDDALEKTSSLVGGDFSERMSNSILRGRGHDEKADLVRSLDERGCRVLKKMI